MVEEFRVWAARTSPASDEAERKQQLEAFPYRDIGAYGFHDAWDLEGGAQASMPVFRTPLEISEDRVRAAVEAWGGAPPEILRKSAAQPVPLLDQRAYLEELEETLDSQAVRLVARLGLTRQALRSDLLRLRPEMVALFCHGTTEGNLLLEVLADIYYADVLPRGETRAQINIAGAAFTGITRALLATG